MNFINKNFKWISLGSNVLAFISLFLPFASVSTSVLGMDINKSVAFIDGDGVIVLFALVAACVLLFIKNNKFTLIPLGISFAIVIYDAINVGNKMGEISGTYGSMIKVSLGIGFYLLLLALIVSIGSLVYANFIMKKVKEPANDIASQANNTVNQMPTEAPTNQPVVEPSQKFCSSCGAKQNPNAKFCEFCGNKLN